MTNLQFNVPMCNAKRVHVVYAAEHLRQVQLTLLLGHGALLLAKLGTVAAVCQLHKDENAIARLGLCDKVNVQLNDVQVLHLLHDEQFLRKKENLDFFL